MLAVSGTSGRILRFSCLDFFLAGCRLHSSKKCRRVATPKKIQTKPLNLRSGASGSLDVRMAPQKSELRKQSQASRNVAAKAPSDAGESSDENEDGPMKVAHFPFLFLMLHFGTNISLYSLILTELTTATPPNHLLNSKSDCQRAPRRPTRGKSLRQTMTRMTKTKKRKIFPFPISKI